MGSRIARMIAGLCLAGLATAASAQQSNNRVAANVAWSVFEGNEPRECWIVAAPEETVNTRDGRVVSVRRSDILLMVFFRPTADVKGQVTFTGGYPFAGGSTVNMNVGGTEFELFTDGEWAWPATEADDAKIVTSLKRGTDVVLTARSSRGTLTKDTFSLLGFTASFEDAEKRCAG